MKFAIITAFVSFAGLATAIAKNPCLSQTLLHLLAYRLTHIFAEFLAAACTGNNNYNYAHCCKYYDNGSGGEVISGGLSSPNRSRSLSVYLLFYTLPQDATSAATILSAIQALQTRVTKLRGR